MATPPDGAPAGPDDTSPPPSSNSSTPPPSDSSTPPPKSSGSGSPSPSPPAPSLSPPPPASPQDSTAPAARGSPAAPSRDSPSPPAPKRSDSDSDNSGSSKSGSGSGSRSRSSGSTQVDVILAGVVIGVLAFSLLMCIAACVCCAKKKRRKKPPHMNMPYYTDEHGNVFYANSMPKWQSSAMDHGWHAPYSPASGDMSGSHGPGLGQMPPSPGMPSLGFSKSSFSYEELAAATGGFSSTNLLGQGGFGYVYKGVLAGSGKEVAVKQLKAGSGQGEREFQAEVEIISRVHHRHLVSLVGYCIAGSSQRLLVYEFVPNNTLEHHLHGKGVPVMAWPARLAIALGSAKGLAYLHEDCHPRIIHRDIKAANILLDVFSFGVMLLELITGRRPVDPTNYMEDSLVDWARPLLARALSEDNFDELLDPRLENRVDRLELERMCSSAAAAVRHSAKRRPKMKQIVRALEGDASLDDLNEGVKPGQSMMFSSGSEYDGANYAANISKFRKVAFESSEFSNDYSGTSEYGADSGEAATQRQQHR
ncbi:Proline-rich receptor-like protein kinase PERK4 [Zea mays]|uniref:non-specific serine/threonine protein kinase n=1 Tax=Zea mays TaxID=4577 RepID=A0A1D6JV66_MAIZE|nr:Proline-rich receptor-like protein kinase PERK4 [Zea mays]